MLLAGLVGLGGPYFTWKNLDQTRRTTQRTLELTEQGQITERFTRAIDQLGGADDKGNKRLEIRLGDIYALERIARDSGDDHGPIVEVLTAYVREHAPWPPERSRTRSEEAPFIRPPTLQGPQPEPAEGPKERADEDTRPDPDVQVVLTVLGRRPRYYKNGEDKPLDLTSTDLRNAILRRAHLEGAILSGANLEGARLTGAYLQEAILSRASLRGAILREAQLGDRGKASLGGTSEIPTLRGRTFRGYA